MGAYRFHIVDVNPNQTTGGGGCLCSETTNTDEHGPYAVFDTEMESSLSPFPVLCLDCAQEVVNQALGGDALAGGETVDSTAEEIPVSEDDVHAAEAEKQAQIEHEIEAVKQVRIQQALEQDVPRV